MSSGLVLRWELLFFVLEIFPIVQLLLVLRVHRIIIVFTVILRVVLRPKGWRYGLLAG